MTNQTSSVDWRANKTFFYQSGPVKHIEFDPTNPLHVMLADLLKSLQFGVKGCEAEKRFANKLAKQVGFEPYYNHDFGRNVLCSDIEVINCNELGYIK